MQLRDGHFRWPQLLGYIADSKVNGNRWQAAFDRVDIPMSFPWGMRDDVFGAHQAEKILRRRPGEYLAALDEVGRYPQVERPDAAIRLITELLEHPRDGRGPRAHRGERGAPARPHLGEGLTVSATVRVDVVGTTTFVTIDRPDVRNAVDGPTAATLHRAFLDFDADGSQSVAVLTGAAQTFCAGADLKAVATGDGNRTEAMVAGDPDLRA